MLHVYVWQSVLIEDKALLDLNTMDQNENPETPNAGNKQTSTLQQAPRNAQGHGDDRDVLVSTSRDLPFCVGDIARQEFQTARKFWGE